MSLKRTTLIRCPESVSIATPCSGFPTPLLDRSSSSIPLGYGRGSLGRVRLYGIPVRCPSRALLSATTRSDNDWFLECLIDAVQKHPGPLIRHAHFAGRA